MLDYEIKAIIQTVGLNLKHPIDKLKLNEVVLEYIRNGLIEMQNDDIIIFGLTKQYETEV